jgi:thioredoxin 1
VANGKGTEKIIQATDANFESEVLKSDKPVLVDFWAVWCGPCKAIAPIVSELSNTYDGKLRVAQVDIDNEQETAAKYNIRSIPTLLMFKNGQVVGQIVGAVPKGKVVAMVESAL